MINPTSPLTGSAITGLITPTFTFITDNPPDSNSKAFVVTALGGTQTGALPHKNEMPFRVTVKRPKKVKIPGTKSLTTGQYLNGGKNEYGFTFVKGVNTTGSSTNPQYDNIVLRFTAAVPATVGNDSVQLDSLFSFAGAFIASQLQGLDDSCKNSVI